MFSLKTLPLHSQSANRAVVNAEVAQLVEHNLAKVRVAGSSPVFRSFLFIGPGGGMVDALVSGASGLTAVQVRVLFWAHSLICAGGGIGRHATLRG